MQIDENLTIKNLIIDSKRSFFHATFHCKDRLFQLYVKCDGKKVSTLRTYEIAEELYEIYGLLPVVKAHVEFCLFVETEKTIVLSCDNEDWLSLSEPSGIATSVVNVTPSLGITEIKGWAFSENNSCDIEVIDGDGNVCDSTIRRMKYEKINDSGIVDKSLFVGFILTFIREENKNYFLEFNHKKKVSLGEFFTERNENKKLSLGTAIKRVSPKMIKRFFEYLHENGLKETIYKIMYGMQSEFDYDAWFRRNRVKETMLEEQRKIQFSYSPKISIITPVFNTPKQLLVEMIESVEKQSYDNWELCLADGSDSDSDARKILEEYVKKDSRIKVTYLKQNYGIAENTNKALELVTGEYTGLFDHDDLLEPDALFEIVQSLQEKAFDALYTDEDKLNGKTLQFEDPNLKSDYNEDLLLSHNYITHFFVVKTDILRNTGGFNRKYDGAQDYDVILKCIEKANGVKHIPKVLYHWRMHEGSTALNPESKMYCYEAGEKAIQDHLDRIGVKATVKMREKPYWGLYHVQYDTKENPLVSIIIPNYDHADVLKTCIDSLYRFNQYENFEIVIVENNSKKKETFDYYNLLQKEHANIRVVTWKGTEFNFSAINNFGVKYVKGEYLLFLNNDTKVISPDAIKEMLGTCMRSNVGIVGGKLLYEDNTIQHAGVVIGFTGYARHIFNDIDGIKEPGFMMRAQLNCDYSAVTAACMMTKKSLFVELNGFDESFKVACNDIDYCMRVRNTGKLVVYNAYARWNHFESKSRGYENNLRKVKRFNHEVEIWQKKWSDILINGDPYYNSNFKLEDEPFELK